MKQICVLFVAHFCLNVSTANRVSAITHGPWRVCLCVCVMVLQRTSSCTAGRRGFIGTVTSDVRVSVEPLTLFHLRVNHTLTVVIGRESEHKMKPKTQTCVIVATRRPKLDPTRQHWRADKTHLIVCFYSEKFREEGSVTICHGSYFMVNKGEEKTP